MAEPTFLVDKKGLAKILARRGKEFIITELLQNAWDENVTTVRIEFEQADGHARLMVADDSPNGFAEISHAYTLFAESKKKGDVEKRGRFNLGEKLVIAICDVVDITTTTGNVHFDDEGRTVTTKPKTEKGTIFEASLRMNKAEAEALKTLVYSCAPPRDVQTFYNGELLPIKDGAYGFTATLPTEVADDDGYLRPTARKTFLKLYNTRGDEKAMLYEMGIPVVELGDQWHVDVQQKVPLNADRDNVTPAYLQKLRVAVFNEMAQILNPEETTQPWVAAAIESKDAKVETVAAVIKQRYGDKVVISDPSDPEGTKIAVSQGYTVLPPRAFSKEAWENVRAAGILPAGQVTPSPKPYQENGDRLERVIEPSKWTKEMTYVAETFKGTGKRLLNKEITVRIVNEPMLPWTANYGPGHPVTLNYGRLGQDWFKRAHGNRVMVWELALHEFAHDRVSDHLSNRFADEVARLGATLADAMIAR